MKKGLVKKPALSMVTKMCVFIHPSWQRHVYCRFYFSLFLMSVLKYHEICFIINMRGFWTMFCLHLKI